ncbi:MAG: hypothetical protein KUG77_26825, partial [Nannocystaceae bacterium]|nr:hypothetical protein [Nannocystaceae bacterium]
MDQAPAEHAGACPLVKAVEGVLGMSGRCVSCVPVRVDALPEGTWENGASIQLSCGVDDVRDFAVFGSGPGATAMVRWLFGDFAELPVTGGPLCDGLAETLNRVVGRIKRLGATERCSEPVIDTPERLEGADARAYADVHPAATVYRVISDAWVGEVVFMASPKRQRAVAALEQATALLSRSGLEPGTIIRACRLLEVVRGPLLALSELPSISITLCWCVETLAELVNGCGGPRDRTILCRVLGELDDLQGAMVRLTAPPETTAFVIPLEEERRALLQDFCCETIRGIERTADIWFSGIDDTPASPLGLMHRVQVTADFFDLQQLQHLSRSTGRLIGSVRQRGAQLTDQQVKAVRHSVLLIETWVEALLAGLAGDGTVAWSPELEAHTRMLDHVLECGGDIVIHVPEVVVPAADATVGGARQLDEGRLSRLEVLRTELREWAELARLEGGSRSLAEPRDFFDRAHQELASICQSVRRASMGPVLARLAGHCREASARHGKLVRVDTTGASLDVPEHLMTAMVVPLAHLIENSIEHGVECRAERRRRGKTVLALVQLRAERIEGSLVLEVADDGRGIATEALRRHGDSSHPGVYRLHARPQALIPKGARGWPGTDVVVREVEAAGGVVEVESVQGEGTRVRIVCLLYTSDAADD